MNIEKIANNSDTFKLQFYQKIEPYINKSIKSGKPKVVLSMEYINKNLDTHYNIDSLYIKMRNMLLGSRLGVSIKRRNEEFVFYEVSDTIKRESDLIKIGFEERLKPCLLEIFKSTFIIGFDEDNLRNVLDVNCSTINIYNTIKKLLSNTNIKVSTRKNDLINGKKTRKFVFYDINVKKQLDEKRIQNKEDEKIRKKDVVKNIKKENEELINDQHLY